MNTKQKNAEQHIRLMKFDCEMRLECLKVAASVVQNPEELKGLTNDIANYVFKGLFKSNEEEEAKE